MAAASTGDSLGVLDRMTLVLEAFDEDDRGLGISELAQRAGLPKSTVSRLVGTLVRQHYLERDGRRVHLGLRLFELGQLAAQPLELRTAALPVLAALRSKTGENVHVAIRDGRGLVCIAAMRGGSARPLLVRIGARLPAHATALGKAVFAHASPSDVDELIASGLEAVTPRTIVDERSLRRELAEIRGGLPALEVGEFRAGVSCVASAVSTPSGGAIAAISVSGPSEGFDVERMTSLTRAAAAEVTRALAARGPAAGRP